MGAYLTFAEYATPALTLSASDIATVESFRPGFVDSRLAYRSAWIAARLGKRYAPFTAPYSPIVTGWLSDLVTLDVMMARGFNPSSQQDALIVQAAADAKAEIKEAADAQTGLFDLPLATGASGISRGTGQSYTEPSPYAWMDRQATAVRRG